MARRRQREQAAASGLPVHLRRGVVRVRDFVDLSERPPSWLHEPDVGWWQVVRAWRRWQDAVVEWGAAQGLDRRQALVVEGGPSCSALALLGAEEILDGREPRR